MVQTGRHPDELFLLFLVRYIYMKFRPTLAEFIGATTAFLRPNWPRRHPDQNTHARTYRPTTNLPSHDRPPSATSSYILAIDRSSCHREIA